MTKIIPVLNLQDIVATYDDPAVLISDEFEIVSANSAYLDLYNLDDYYNDTGLSDGSDNNLLNPNNVRLSNNLHCYEISHLYSRSCDQEGESCPLQLAKSTKKNQRVLHVHHTRYGDEHIDISLYPIKDINEKIYFLEVMKTIKHESPKSVEKGMVGKAPSFNKLLELISRVAEYDISVLLQGESGSGKELVAHSIHQASFRKTMHCITVECSGLSESLFESELFGHEKGAFTGAVNKKKGLVEEAEGGTLFLDEIGDVPLSLQVKLLRLIETRTFRRVGGIEQLNADFRLVCATHKNLKAMVKKGEFREDLYYRISTFPIKLPALRERLEDIPLLVDTILERISGPRKMHVSNEVLAFFSQYKFPGNIRELRNILELGRVMTDSNVIEITHLPENIFEDDQKKVSVNSLSDKEFIRNFKAEEQIIEQLMTLEQHENEYLMWLNQYFKDDKKILAEKLGVSERTLYRKLKALE
ncbi:MAG: sigma-54 dependent transcriptional regulator [gamma proteobacterium symbiont of Bathyaustriella thionipta]|nr:sigma-54 dependent transcriptional regulator [gamma proteobacterium symbiont of Bathyaustriella thionipta]MCU7950496.1 sigma-54 dependent transcriptional regulator [gamma proteobacterium symbiont of Bathyaustriella thionipta]MCU7953169.1 sigma-54 dependent transcriptional regulator [gamma proteobacterium symbiont of Bathyaustriella thionipta]MCU7956990.1 sigma-54 dependent transcriptional regulator [gamma proteobacterium symbiont of Bathyaustriella thionipta]MCU7968284.1 sigma-54 dependent t